MTTFRSRKEEFLLGSIITNPDLATETLIPVSQAGKYFPVPVARPTIERLMRVGKNGICLESIMIGGRRYVSEEGIARFVQRTNQQSDGHGRPRKTSSELETAQKELGL